MSAPLAHPINGDALPDLQAPYAERCEARALLFFNGQLSLHNAVDELQAYAEDSGLIDHIGQDEAQRIMGEAFAMAEAVPDELNEACEQEILLATADLVRRWEADDASRRADPPRRPAPYQPPQSTINAFWYVVGLCNPVQLTAWLDNHPQDAPFLLKLLEAK